MVITLFQFVQAPFVEAVRQRHEGFIPLFVPGLVASDQQHGVPLGVKDVQNPVGPAVAPMRNSCVWA